MFGEFNEAAQPKTSLGKYSIEFNYLAVQIRPLTPHEGSVQKEFPT